jgi:hypothetical protein
VESLTEQARQRIAAPRASTTGHSTLNAITEFLKNVGA